MNTLINFLLVLTVKTVKVQEILIGSIQKIKEVVVYMTINYTFLYSKYVINHFIHPKSDPTYSRKWRLLPMKQSL